MWNMSRIVIWFSFCYSVDGLTDMNDCLAGCFYVCFTRVRIRVRIAVRFRARFVRKQNRDPILFLSPITMVCLHILTKKTQKITCWALLAANRTPNRTGIHMENRTCRRPLKGDGRVGFHAGKARKIKMPRGARK
jgi:hypothetical protein